MEIEVLVVGAVVVAVVVAMVRAQQLAAARQAYQAALAALTRSPADNRLRVAALEAGRRFADLARKAAGSRGRAIFDEVALSNDLGARSAAAATVAADAKPCPQCAETVKREARVCRFCQHRFEAAG